MGLNRGFKGEAPWAPDFHFKQNGKILVFIKQNIESNWNFDVYWKTAMIFILNLKIIFTNVRNVINILHICCFS